MKPLIWICLAFNLLALTGCIVAPYGGRGGYYHGGHEGYHGDYRR
jgi:hypothetical protein